MREDPARIAIPRMAKVNFAEHKIGELSKSNDYCRVWRCGRPSSVLYSFIVTVRPGCLYINGDIGDLMLSCSSDMIGWAREAVGSPGYLFSKSPSLRSLKTWDWGRFRARLDELVKGEHGLAKEQAEEIIRSLKFGIEARPFDWAVGQLLELGWDWDDACEFAEGCKDWPPNAWWCLEGLKRFIELHDAALAVSEA